MSVTQESLAKEDLETELVYKLRTLGYIGYFPNGILVLLVSISNCLDEAKVTYPGITLSILKDILRRKNILVFSTLESYSTYLGKRKK